MTKIQAGLVGGAIGVTITLTPAAVMYGLMETDVTNLRFQVRERDDRIQQQRLELVVSHAGAAGEKKRADAATRRAEQAELRADLNDRIADDILRRAEAHHPTEPLPAGGATVVNIDPAPVPLPQPMPPKLKQ